MHAFPPDLGQVCSMYKVAYNKYVDNKISTCLPITTVTKTKGVNSALEDVFVLQEVLDQCDDNVEAGKHKTYF